MAQWHLDQLRCRHPSRLAQWRQPPCRLGVQDRAGVKEHPMKRRDFLAAAAASPAAALPALAQPAHPACLPDWSKLPSRPAGKIEVVYKTKHGQPNGLALADNPGQMWVLDQGAEHWVTLTDIKDGSTVREFQADVVGPSGLVQDGNT